MNSEKILIGGKDVDLIENKDSYENEITISENEVS